MTTKPKKRTTTTTTPTERIVAIPPAEGVKYNGATGGIIHHAERIVAGRYPMPLVPDVSDLPDLLTRAHQAHDMAVATADKLTTAREAAEAAKAELARAEADTHPDLSEADALAAIVAAREANDRAGLNIRRLTAVFSKSDAEATALTREVLSRAKVAAVNLAVQLAAEGIASLRAMLHPDIVSREPRVAAELVRPLAAHLRPVSEVGSLEDSVAAHITAPLDEATHRGHALRFADLLVARVAGGVA
jgi:hypothetical protein